MLLLLNPELSTDLRDRGLVHYEVGDFIGARKDLTSYLELEPDAGDGEVIRAHLREIDSQLTMFR